MNFNFRHIIFKTFSILLILFCLIQVQNVNAQRSTEEQMGIQFYQQGEYENAKEIFEKLFEKNPESQYYYDYYINSLIHTQDYKTAERLLNRLSRRNPDKLHYTIDLGYIHKLQGENDKSRELFEKVIKELPNNQGLIHSVANTFYRRDALNFAIETYLKGRKIINDDNAFGYQLARFYRFDNAYDKMADEYLNIISYNPQFIDNVKNAMQEIVEEDAHYDMLRQKLIRRIQSTPEVHTYTDLLSWLFTQRKDFNSAFIQLRAIDRRLNEQGKRLIELAQVCISNNDLEIAGQIYEYVLGYGEKGRYYMPARRGLLEVRYHKIIKGYTTSEDELNSVVSSFQNYLDVFGPRHRESANIIFKLAELKAIYMDNIDDAIVLLESVINEPNLSKHLHAEAKLDLAKYYLLTGREWRATLLYGQIEKDFKDHPLGHEAKFNNARLSYYRGEFQWAQAQLDVLKGSTSELIANDALHLALLIRDNIGLDTLTAPLEMFAKSELLIFRKRYAEALDILNQILKLYPDHELEDNVYLAKAHIMVKQKEYVNAVQYLEKVYTNYSEGILADNALYMAANIFLDQLNDTQKAIECLELLIFDHPDSIFALDAREKYRKLRGDVVN